MNIAHILTAQPELYYFGKFPARGDFVRSPNGSALMNVFDQWISRALDMLAPDPRWKLDYDGAAPVRFAFIGTRSRQVVAGVLTPSMDSSARRFPFVLATHLEAARALDFFALAPLRLAHYWQSAELTGLRARQAQSDQHFLAHLQQQADGLQADAGADARLFDNWLHAQTIERVEQELRSSYPAFSLRQTVLALGLLLQPVLIQGAANLNKGLLLPLPGRADSRALLACFWLRLIAGFLPRHDFELSVLLARMHERPVLLVGFAGAAAETLAATISPASAGDYLVDMSAVDWVDDYLDGDTACRKLASYAEHPQLSLAQLLSTFNEVFLGL